MACVSRSISINVFVFCNVSGSFQVRRMYVPLLTASGLADSGEIVLSWSGFAVDAALSAVFSTTPAYEHMLASLHNL